MDAIKPTHTIVLDAGPILQNNPPVSTLLSKSESLVTVPSVISEIKDADARSRVETTLVPFLTIKNPSPLSIKFVSDFARRTGDLAVLSRTDVEILALAYELEAERNGGDWRLRKVPGQKGLNGSAPEIVQDANTDPKAPITTSANAAPTPQAPWSTGSHAAERKHEVAKIEDAQVVFHENLKEVGDAPEVIIDGVSKDLRNLDMQDTGPKQEFTIQRRHEPSSEVPTPELEPQDSDSSDSEGWITPSNIKNHQAADTNASTTATTPETVMQVASITTDFAMQNVLLQIGLNLLSPSLQRIRNIKTYILRCHACFQTVKDTSKQFCPRCGKPTLTRVSCSTNQKGEFRIHLKKNRQWNHRGDRYSIPKPVPGSANGKVGQARGGGKGGWGQELVLTEDQKEYQRAVTEKGRSKGTNLMDEDYSPRILSGDRGRAGGRPKVGAGRNVNSKKRV